MESAQKHGLMSIAGVDASVTRDSEGKCGRRSQQRDERTGCVEADPRKRNRSDYRRSQGRTQ